MPVLYRKYRPRDFSGFIGQEGIVNFLKGCLTKDSMPHAMIFAGPRGTGKTSLARILALIINCQKSDPAKFQACLKCDSCKHILETEFSDLIEMDAASNRRIDDVRSVIDLVHLPPHFGKKKIYLIDEAHMFTTEAFNALLKTLEEPPQHVIFILATTELDKFPQTILSRCQILHFQTINQGKLSLHLKEVAEAEKLKISSDILDLISQYSEGCVRDALGILEQVTHLPEISQENVSKFLNILGTREIENIISSVREQDEKTFHEIFDHVETLGINPRSLLRQLIRYSEKSMAAEKVNSASWKFLYEFIKNLLMAAEHMPLSISQILTIKLGLLETMHWAYKNSISSQNMPAPARASAPAIVEERSNTLKHIAAGSAGGTVPPDTATARNIKSSGISDFKIDDPVIKGLLIGQVLENTPDKIIIRANSQFIFDRLHSKEGLIAKSLGKPIEIILDETPLSDIPKKVISREEAKPAKTAAEKHLLDVFGSN